MFFYENTRLIVMKIEIEKKIRSHRYYVNKTRP